MSSKHRIAGLVLLAVAGWCLAFVPMEHVRATPQDPTNTDKQGQPAKQDSGDKKDNPDQDKKDKKDAKAKGGARVPIIVVNAQQAPIKGAVAQMWGDNSTEQKTTSAEGQASFQVRDGLMTLRVQAPRMTPFQKLLTDDEKKSGLRVVMTAR